LPFHQPKVVEYSINEDRDPMVLYNVRQGGFLGRGKAYDQDGKDNFHCT